MVIWTRSLADWPKDKKVLSPLLSRIVHFPCIETVGIDQINLTFMKQVLDYKNSKKTVCVFTSANTVDYTLRHEGLKELLSNSINLCVGASTLAALEKAGFQGFHPPQVKNASDLTQYIKTEMFSIEHRLVLIGGKIRALDMIKDLQAQNFACHRLDVYETISVLKQIDGKALTKKQKQNHIDSLSGSVCFFSPSAVKAFVKVFAPKGNRLMKSLTAICVGESTAKSCEKDFAKILISASPHVSEVVKLAKE